MTNTYRPRGRFFEEFALGDMVVSAGRTITETDIVNFAGLSGDFTEIHTNSEYARQGPFGQRIAHGLLVTSIASGLLAQRGFLEGTVLAFREMIWKFSLPAFIGDTIRTQAVVTDLKAIPRLGGGAVTLDIEIINQAGKTIQSGKWVVLMAGKDRGAEEK